MTWSNDFTHKPLFTRSQKLSRIRLRTRGRLKVLLLLFKPETAAGMMHRDDESLVFCGLNALFGFDWTTLFYLDKCFKSVNIECHIVIYL